MTGPLAPRVVVAAPPQIIKKGPRLRRRLYRRVVFASLRGQRPFGPRVVDRPMGNEFYNAACGGHVHIEYHNQDYHRPPLRHFVALFP